MMNFSLGLLLSVVVVPFAILIKPKDPEGTDGKRYVHFYDISIKYATHLIYFNSNLRLITRLYGLLLHPLVVSYVCVLALTWGSFPELDWKLLLVRALKATMDAITFAIVDSMIYGNWMFKLVTVVFLPVWIIFWNVTYPRTGTRQKLKIN